MIVVEGNVIKNTMLHVEQAPDHETMLKLKHPAEHASERKDLK